MQHRQFLLYGVVISAIFALGVVNIPTASADYWDVYIVDGSGAPGCEETVIGCYDPEFLEVGVGDTVTWHNTDSAAHTVTSGSAWDDFEYVGNDFDSSLFMAGTTFEHTFDQPGEIPYFCMVHPWMAGVVIVGGGALPPTIPDNTVPFDNFCTDLQVNFDTVIGEAAVDDYCNDYYNQYGDYIDIEIAKNLINNIRDEIESDPPPVEPDPDNNIPFSEFCDVLHNQFDFELDPVTVDDMCNNYSEQYGNSIDSRIADDIVQMTWNDLEFNYQQQAPPEFEYDEALGIPDYCRPIIYDMYVHVDRIYEVDRTKKTFDAIILVEVWAQADPDGHVDFNVQKPIKTADLDSQATSVLEMPQIEFIDSIGGLTVTDISRIPDPSLGTYKVEGKFIGNFNFDKFPFETLQLPIRIDPVGDMKDDCKFLFSNEQFGYGINEENTHFNGLCTTREGNEW